MPATSIVASGGSNQEAYTSTEFPIALFAQVFDGASPIAGVTVIFRLPPQTGPSASFVDGSGNTAVAITAATGIAESPKFKANAVAGGLWNPSCEVSGRPDIDYQLYYETNKVRVPSVPATVTFTLGTNQNVAFNAPYSTLQVRVQDQYGDLLPNVPVTWSVPAGYGTFPGAVLSVVVNTDFQGLSTAPVLTAGTTAGTFQIRAQSSVAAVFTTANGFNVNPAVATQLRVSSGNNQKASAAFALPLKVSVLNGVNGSVAGVSVTFTGPGSGASCTFPGGGTAVTVASDAGGIASSGTVTANDTLGAYSVTASSSGLSSITFSLTNGLNYKPEVCTPQESIDCFNTNAGGVGTTPPNWSATTDADAAGGGNFFAGVTVAPPNTNRSNVMRTNQPASWAAIPDDARITKILFQHWVRGGGVVALLEVTPFNPGAAASPSNANFTPTNAWVQRPLNGFNITGADSVRTGALLKAGGWGVNFRQSVSSGGSASENINGLTISVCYQEVDAPVSGDVPLMFCE